MIRIRFHGRGGQGIKVASRILGRAFFLHGYQVQDAPRYGAERRGAPIFAYVRADSQPIHERGVVVHPDLVIVADDSLFAVTADAVQQGWLPHTQVVLYSARPHSFWQTRLSAYQSLFVVPVVPDGAIPRGTLCAAAAARVCGLIERRQLLQAVDLELPGLTAPERQQIQKQVTAVYDGLTPPLPPEAESAGAVDEIHGGAAPEVDWVELKPEPASVAAPLIRAPASSEALATGLWRCRRPQLLRSRCRRCGLCATLCPEGAISLDEDGYPQIDYGHCKGCLICVEQCPVQALIAVEEASQWWAQPAEEERADDD